LGREWDEYGREVMTQERPRARREWDENGRPVTEAPQPARRDRRAERDAYLTRNYTPMGGAVASLSQGATLGFGDEIEGGMQALAAGAEEAFRPGPDYLGRIGRRARLGYDYGRDTTNLFVERHRREAPIASALNEVGGAIVTGGVGGGGRAATQQGAQRGLPLWLRQTGEAGAIGGAYGAAYGFGSGDGDIEDRLENAGEGAMTGAAFGAAAPTVINAARPAWEALARGASRLPIPRGPAAGAFGVPMRSPPPPPARLPRAAAGTIDRLADRARMTPDEVEAALAAARRQPQGQVLADLFDEPGRQTTRALAQWPGRTGQRGREVFRQRAGEQPTRILDALRRGLQVGETRSEAVARLAGEYRRASAETYQPLFSQPMSQKGATALEAGLANLRISPTVQRAERRARELFNDELAAGLTQGTVHDHAGRYAHYLRMAINDIIAQGKRDASLVGHSQRAAIELRNRLTEALESALPGYREARQRWGGLADAEEALDVGADFLRSSPDAVRRQLQGMTDFERQHARIGLVDEITQGMRGGRVVGQKNVANALDYRDTQEIIAAAFDNPQQAADFLDTLNTSNQLMTNASSWGGGSSTAANAAHGADEALNTAADMTGDVLTGKPGSAVARGVRGVVNSASLGTIERANNARGEALLTRVDTEDAETFARQVVDELRRRAQLRRQASAASRRAGAAGGVGANRRSE
jgi:hypothetical protein